MSHTHVLGTGLSLITGGALTGEIWECGVFRGDTAEWMRGTVGSGHVMRLFDTFSGMPVSGPFDSHKVGTMKGTDLDYVKGRFTGDSTTYFHPGVMPSTFSGLENSTIALVNIDVDQYQSVKDCLNFTYPRMASGGYVVLDDYACPDCPGARKAVDEFMVGKPEALVIERDPQAYFIKA